MNKATTLNREQWKEVFDASLRELTHQTNKLSDTIREKDAKIASLEERLAQAREIIGYFAEGGYMMTQPKDSYIGHQLKVWHWTQTPDQFEEWVAKEWLGENHK